MKTLLTGFGPFLSHETNPTELIVRDIIAPEKVELFRKILPVNFQKIEPSYTKLLDTIQPDLILNTGLNASKGGIQLEYVALNIGADHAPKHHFFEAVPQNEPALVTQLPIDEWASQLCTRGIPTVRSNHAGTYLCNYLYYLSLNWCKQQGSGNALFVHVPYTTELASQICLNSRQVLPSLPQAMIEQALTEIMKKEKGTCHDIA